MQFVVNTTVLALRRLKSIVDDLNGYKSDIPRLGDPRHRTLDLIIKTFDRLQCTLQTRIYRISEHVLCTKIFFNQR